MFRWLRRLPTNHPTGSAVSSMVISVMFIIIFIVGLIARSTVNYATPDQAQSASTSVTVLGVLAFLSAVVLALAIYAAVDTQGFKIWKTDSEGRLPHPIPRWAGPIFLIILVFEFIILFYFIAAMLGGVAESVSGGGNSDKKADKDKYPWEK